VVGDTFVFGARWCVTNACGGPGLRLPPTTRSKVRPTWAASFRLDYLADAVRKLLADKRALMRCPDQVRDCSRCTADFFARPRRAELLVETFPRGNKQYLVCYPSEAGWRI